MNLKIYITLFFIFHSFSLYYWSGLKVFVLIFALLSLWIFLEKKYKEKVNALSVNVFLILISIIFGYSVKVPDYRNYSSGNYIVSDSSHLNRSENFIFSENKYVLEDVVGKNKFIVNCSLFFGDCNINKKDDLVFIKYVNSCSLLFCEKYIYEVKGGGVDLSYKNKKKKYNGEEEVINQFLFYYLFIDLLFIGIFFIKLRGIMLTKTKFKSNKIRI